MSCDPIPGGIAEVQAPVLPDGVPALTSFYLYLTAGCNLCCRHCWIVPSFVDGVPSPGDCLDVDLLRQAVAEAKPLGLRHAKLTGGEPVLHPRFVEIVDLLTAEGLSMNMETNGTLIDAGLARHLKERTNVGFISVSVDGPSAALHDSFRGMPGAFDAAVRGFEHLVAAGYRPQVIMSVHRGNVQAVAEMVDFAVRLGAGSVKFNPVVSSGRGIAMRERGETLDFDEVMALAHWIRGPLQQRTPTCLILSTPPALCTVAELRVDGISGLCYVRHILGILGSGEMALCGIGRTIPELCFGRLGQDSVADVWQNHALLQELRQGLKERFPGVCGQCIHAASCQTYCPAHNYQDTGQLLAPAWLCAEAYARGAFPATRLRRQG